MKLPGGTEVPKVCARPRPMTSAIVSLCLCQPKQLVARSAKIKHNKHTKRESPQLSVLIAGRYHSWT